MRKLEPTQRSKNNDVRTSPRGTYLGLVVHYWPLVYKISRGLSEQNNIPLVDIIYTDIIVTSYSEAYVYSAFCSVANVSRKASLRHSALTPV